MKSLSMLIGISVLIGACSSPAPSPPASDGSAGVPRVVADVRGIT